MTPIEIKAILYGLGGGANKRLGQHFLIDRTVLQTIVDAADIHPGDLVLEIGPGLGVLTKELLANDAEVVAIEKDRRFAKYLNSTLTPPLESRGGARGGVTVIHGDAAIMHWHEIIGDNPWKLISNLPYSITSLALRKALWAPRPASRIVVLVQREVAERAIALTPSGSHLRMGRGSLLSLMVAFASTSARIVKRVAAGSFYPSPKVESAILEIIPMITSDRERKWGIDPEQIMEVAKAGFVHPRKKLMSNLIESQVYPKAAVEKSFISLGFSPNIRAEQLSPEQWAALAVALKTWMLVRP